MIGDHARGARGDLEGALEVRVPRCVGLRDVVIEPQRRPFVVRKVGEDVVAGDVDLAVLDVFRMREVDLLDRLHFLEQQGTGEAVEVGARNQPHS